MRLWSKSYHPLIASAGSIALPVCIAAVPTTNPSFQDRQQAAELSRKASELIDQRRYAEAEATLRQSLAIVRNHPVRLYNLACALIGEQKYDAALEMLEKATACGFSDFGYLAQDPTLQPLRKTARYATLLARKDEIQRHAAQLAIDQLKSQLGDSYRYDVDVDLKLIYAVSLDQPTLEVLKHDLAIQARSQWSQLFANRSGEFIRVIVPSPADFNRLVPLSHVGGRYDDDTRTVIVQHLGQFVTHEFTHALHAADQHAIGQEHAVWVSEGLASLYESAEVVEDRLLPRENSRLPAVRAAAQRHTIIPLHTLLQMPRDGFNQRPELTYGESSGLLLYLNERGLLREFYDAFKENWSFDQTGRRALEEVTDLSLTNLEKAWTQWLLSRPETRPASRPNGPLLGVRLVEVVDGLKITEIIPGGAAQKGRLKADDVIIGVEGKEIRDRATLDRLLAIHEAGEQVTLRVRRGNEYLELSLKLGRRDIHAGL